MKRQSMKSCFVVGLVSLGVAMGPMAQAAGKRGARKPAAGKPAAREQAAEVFNVASYLAGARALNEQGQPKAGDFLLIDEDLSNAVSFNQENPGVPFVLELAEPFELTEVQVANPSSSREDGSRTRVKRVRFEQGEKWQGPWKPLAEVSLDKRTEQKPQGRKVSAKGVRYLRITPLENQGNTETTLLSEVRVLGTRPAPREVQFTGVWTSAQGELVLTQQGERVTGCYGNAYGQQGARMGEHVVEGTVEGATLSGLRKEFSEEGTLNFSQPVVFTLTAEGDLSGTYNHGSRWDAKRKAKASIVCDKPEAHLAAELKSQGRVVLKGILFDPGKDTLRSESIPVLEALATAMREDAAKRYVIEGHTDNRSGESFNQGLSERRAAAVKDWLVKKGIDVKRLQAKGLGTSKPVLPNDTEAGRAANRRVEVAVSE
jgi:outer membrane protein OmpA-like peptidoglycan-associated protein